MNKGLNTIGMCKCANKISYGETLIKDIQKRVVSLVVICSDTSDNSKKKIIDNPIHKSTTKFETKDGKVKENTKYIAHIPKEILIFDMLNILF